MKDLTLTSKSTNGELRDSLEFAVHTAPPLFSIAINHFVFNLCLPKITCSSLTWPQAGSWRRQRRQLTQRDIGGQRDSHSKTISFKNINWISTGQFFASQSITSWASHRNRSYKDIFFLNLLYTRISYCFKSCDNFRLIRKTKFLRRANLIGPRTWSYL